MSTKESPRVSATRPRSEIIAEYVVSLATIGLLALTYHTLRLFDMEQGLAQIIAVATVPVVLLTARTVLDRRKPASQEIRDAATGHPGINPLFVCLMMASTIVLVELVASFFLGAAFGSALGLLLANSGVEASQEEFLALLTEATPVLNTFSIIVMVVAIWPITQRATCYLRRFDLLWVLGALVLSRLLDLGLLGASLAIPSPVRSFVDDVVDGSSWLETSALSLALAIILVPPALIGYLIGRRRRPVFLLGRAFRRLRRDDREAVLELLLVRVAPVTAPIAQPVGTSPD